VTFSARRALVLGGSLALCPGEIPLLTEGAIEAGLPLAFGVVLDREARLVGLADKADERAVLGWIEVR
jgi:hypothetical protein